VIYFIVITKFILLIYIYDMSSSKTLGPGDAAAIRLNNMLELRRQARRNRDVTMELQIVRDLTKELKELDARGVKRVWNNSKSYDGGAGGRSYVLLSTMIKKASANLRELQNGTDTEEDTKETTTGDTKSSLMPKTITPTTITPPPAYNDRKTQQQLNRFLTQVKQIEITPEDYIRGLDLEQLTSLPPSLVSNPTYSKMIKERKEKLDRKQKAMLKLQYEKEMEQQKKIEASKQTFDEQHETDDFNIAPSELSIRNIDHMNPIMMRQFQFDPPDNIPVQAKNLQEKDTLRRATRIKVYDDEPKTTDKAGEKLERSMKQRLRKPKVKFEPSNEQRQPLQSFQVTNRGESGLDASEMYELLGFKSDGSRDEHTEATLRYIRDRY
jgi:hypothetical protein